MSGQGLRLEPILLRLPSACHNGTLLRCQIFWVVSASQLWLAPLLLARSDECTVSRGRTADGRVRVECPLQCCFYFGCVQSQKEIRCATLSSVVTRICLKMFCTARLEFQRNASRKNSNLHWMRVTCMHGSLSVSSYLVQSADQIRRHPYSSSNRSHAVACSILPPQRKSLRTSIGEQTSSMPASAATRSRLSECPAGRLLDEEIACKQKSKRFLSPATQHHDELLLQLLLKQSDDTFALPPPSLTTTTPDTTPRVPQCTEHSMSAHWPPPILHWSSVLTRRVQVAQAGRIHLELALPMAGVGVFHLL